MFHQLHDRLIDLYAAVFNWFSQLVWPVNGNIESFLWHHGIHSAFQMDLVTPEMDAVLAVLLTVVYLVVTRKQLAR